MYVIDNSKIALHINIDYKILVCLFVYINGGWNFVTYVC